MTLEQLFTSWFTANFRLNRNSERGGRDALESDRAIAVRIGYPAMSDTGFSEVLAGDTATMEGMAFSGKSGVMLWSGWVLEPFTVADIAGASPLPDRPE